MPVFTKLKIRPGFLLLSILAAAVPFPLNAAAVTIYWEGTISGIASFGQDAVPFGLEVGTPIFGSAIFDSSQSSGQQYILSSNTYGKNYQYGDPLTLTITAAGYEWRVRGGMVSLFGYSYEDTIAVSFYSTSNSGHAESFPNQAGPFDLGFTLYDDQDILGLYDTYELENTIFDLAQTTLGLGSFTTRLWDDTGELVGGYYVDFAINRASETPIPETSSFGLIAGGLGMAFIVRKRRRK